MHPVLVKLGPVTIHYYGLMYVIAISIGLVLVAREVRRKGLGLSTEDLFDLLLLTIPVAILCARLYYVAFLWKHYGRNLLDILKIWQGGLAIHGGVIGGALAVYLFSRWKRQRFLALTDAICPSLILGQAIGRIGNLMNGDAHGLPTTLPWGLRFPAGTPAGEQFPNAPTHPTMIYEMILNALIFVLLWRLRKRGYKEGFLTALYAILYSIGRGVVSFVRADSLMLGSLRAAHLLSAIVIVCGAAWILWGRLYRRTMPGTAPPGRSAVPQDRSGSRPETRT